MGKIKLTAKTKLINEKRTVRMKKKIQRKRQNSQGSSTSDGEVKEKTRRSSNQRFRNLLTAKLPNRIHGNWIPLKKDTRTLFELIFDESSRVIIEDVRQTKAKISCQNHFNELKHRLVEEMRNVNGPLKTIATYQDIKKETTIFEEDLKVCREEIECIEDEIDEYERSLNDIEDEIYQLEC